MKIFITFSGAQGNELAIALKEWLENIFNGIDIFVSSEDLKKGKRWRSDVSARLQESEFGVACLTRDTLNAAWILFESGALTKNVKESALYTVLFGGLQKGHVSGPLADFNHTLFDKGDMFKLLRSINEAHAEKKWKEEPLKNQFENFWTALESTVAKILKTQVPVEQTPDPNVMLQEILETVRQLAKMTPQQGEAILAGVRGAVRSYLRENEMLQQNAAAFNEALTSTSKQEPRKLAGDSFLSGAGRPSMNAIWQELLERARRVRPRLLDALLDAKVTERKGVITVALKQTDNGEIDTLQRVVDPIEEDLGVTFEFTAFK